MEDGQAGDHGWKMEMTTNGKELALIQRLQMEDHNVEANHMKPNQNQ